MFVGTIRPRAFAFLRVEEAKARNSIVYPENTVELAKQKTADQIKIQRSERL